MTAVITRQLPTKSRGVSLLENLVALLVITIGLLGIAGLQIYTLKSGTMTAQRLTAIQQANDIADSIRANTGSVLPTDGSVNPYDLVTPLTAAALAPPDCAVTVCTPQELAEYDIKKWADDNSALLPGDPDFAGGYVARQDLLNDDGTTSWVVNSTSHQIARSRYTIVIFWDGDRTGATGINCPPQSADDMDCFRMELEL